MCLRLELTGTSLLDTGESDDHTEHDSVKRGGQLETSKTSVYKEQTIKVKVDLFVISLCIFLQDQRLNPVFPSAAALLLFLFFTEYM